MFAHEDNRKYLNLRTVSETERKSSATKEHLEVLDERIKELSGAEYAGYKNCFKLIVIYMSLLVTVVTFFVNANLLKGPFVAALVASSLFYIIEPDEKYKLSVIVSAVAFAVTSILIGAVAYPKSLISVIIATVITLPVGALSVPYLHRIKKEIELDSKKVTIDEERGA